MSILKVKSAIKNVWSRTNRFVISVMIASLVILTYQIMIYIANVDLKERHRKEVNFITDIRWNIIENIINNSIEDARHDIYSNIIPAIVDNINTEYGSDIVRLESDLGKLSDFSYENPVAKIIADNIRGKYFKDIISDSNDIFVLMDNVGIISDLSISTSSDVDRTVSYEISQHYNKHLAEEAYNVILKQNQQKKYIFWQRYEPDSEIEMITEMKLSNLKELFKISGGNIDSLKTFEFLVPAYIFMDRDILGNYLVRDRGQRQEIYQFVVVQGFNVTELIQADKNLSNIFDNMKMEDINKKYKTMSAIYQIMVLIGLISLVYIALSAIRIKRKYNL